MDWPFDISEPNLSQLYSKLAALEIGTAEILDVGERLTRPCYSFALSAIAPGANLETHVDDGVIESRLRTFDGDVAAQMLRLDEGQPGSGAKWKNLSRKERQQARWLWDWTDKPHGLNVTPQGRPCVVDSALVLCEARVICEATNRPRFTIARSLPSNKPYGPMWEALIEALPLAHSFLAIRYSAYGDPSIGRITTKRVETGLHTEAIAEIVTLTQSELFSNLCGTQTPSSADVTCCPAEFRLKIADARRLLRAQKR